MPRLRYLLSILLYSATALSQQIVQRGPMGRPTAILDSVGQWTDAIPVLSAPDVDMYIPDVSAPDWLKRHYKDFQARGQYQITMITHYKSSKACQANQTSWGLADAAHLDACALNIAYRMRRALVDPNLKTVTLIRAGMIDPDGNLDSASIEERPLVRSWAELDLNTQAALERTTDLVNRQMRRYDRRVRASQ